MRSSCFFRNIRGYVVGDEEFKMTVGRTVQCGSYAPKNATPDESPECFDKTGMCLTIKHNVPAAPRFRPDVHGLSVARKVRRTRLLVRIRQYGGEAVSHGNLRGQAKELH